MMYVGVKGEGGGWFQMELESTCTQGDTGRLHEGWGHSYWCL